MEKRVANLEKTVGDMRIDVATIKNQVLHLATSAKVEEIAAQLPHLATKAEIRAVESSIIKWTIGSMFASAGLIATITFGLLKLVK